jgi:hypothetical protein
VTDLLEAAPPATRTVRPTPRSGAAALLAGAIWLAIYAWGAAPTVLPGDAAELAAVAFKGGVAHTPGYPTYVLVGQVAGALLPGDPSHRIALLSSFMGALSVGLFALVLAECGLAWGALLAASLALGGTFTLWWSAIRVEVYTMGLALALFAVWRVLVARRTLLPKDGLLAAFAIGLAMTVHLSFGVLLALSGLALAAHARRAGLLTPALVAGGALALLVGLSPYLYLPFADARYTLTNHLRMAIEPAGGQYGLTPERFDSTWERMRFLLAGPEASPRALAAHLPTAFVNVLHAVGRSVLFDIGPLLAVLALLGVRTVFRRDVGAATVLVAAGVLTPLLGSIAVDSALLDVFMLGTTVAALLLAAGAFERIARPDGRRTWLALLVAIAAIALPHELRVRAQSSPNAWPAGVRPRVEGPPPVRTRVPSFRDETRARREALAVLAAIPESSFVAARWDRVTVLKYLQSAEGMRPDLWFDVWYEPSHIVRLARWQRDHSLSSRPVVVVDSIAGLDERLASPEELVLPEGVSLRIERSSVDTSLVRALGE